MSGFAVLWAQAMPVGQAVPWLRYAAWLLLGFAAAFPLVVAYVVLAERKLAGRFQDRIGPNRVGPFGTLQPIADLIKLLTKEDIVPEAADPVMHLAGPVILTVSAMAVLAVVPMGFGGLDEDGHLTGLVPVDLPAGLLYLIAMASVSAVGVFLSGWASRNKYALLGAMRAVAQLVSYEIPQVLATVPALLWAGSLSLVTVVDRQVELGWFVWSPPGFVAFVTVVVASIAEVNRAPFDLPEAESELVAGFHTEYSGMRFGLFFLAEYMNVFTVGCLASVLFLGGGALPFTSFPKGLLGGSVAMMVLANVISVGTFAVKVGVMVFLMFWVRATLPRLRVDQLMGFAWKFLVPLGLLNLPISALWFELAIREPDRSRVMAWVWTGFLELMALGMVAGVNSRKVGRRDVVGSLETDWVA